MGPGVGGRVRGGAGAGVKGRISLQDSYTDCGFSMTWTGLLWLKIGTDGGSSYECGNDPSGSIIWGEEVIIIIFINCNWVVTRWQWLFYM